MVGKKGLVLGSLSRFSFTSYLDYKKLVLELPCNNSDKKKYIFLKQGRLEPVETRMKNNKRGIGADIVKKKVAKPDRGDSAKADNKQVIIFLRFSFDLKGF
jgi:hypothetical protein